MAGNTLSQAERDRLAAEEMTAAAGRIKEFATGVAKAVTTDLPGFLMDLGDKLSGKTATLGERDNSGKLFEKLTGVKSTGSPAEIVGGMFSPETAVKAMIVSAARLGKINKAIDLPEAERMISFGAPNTNVYGSTGVYKDKDFSRKSTLSDRDATVKSEPDPQNKGKVRNIEPNFLQTKLPQILDHPNLYKLYPELEDIKVLRNFTYPSGDAKYYPGFKTITLGPADDADELKSMILHEVQHAVSNADNGVKGGTAKQFLSYDPQKLAEKIKKYKNDPDPSIVAAAYRLEDSSKRKQAEAFFKYQDLPGEQEARFTQSTRNLDEVNLANQLQYWLMQNKTPSNR